MKTLRTLTAWLMVIVCFSMTSCSNNDEGNDSASIVGIWQDEEEGFVSTLDFNKDGSFQMTDKEYYDGKWYTNTDKGKYVYEDDVLTFFYEDGETYSFIVKSLTSKRLKLYDEGEGIFTYSKM